MVLTARHLLLACLCGSLAVACKEPAPERSAERAAAPEPAAAVETPAPSEQPALPARAYFNVENAGVFVLDEQGWRLLFSSRSTVYDIAEIGGQLYALSAFGVQRIDEAGTAQTVAELDAEAYGAIGRPTRMAGDGAEFWVLGFEGVGRWSGTWDSTPLRSISTQPSIGKATSSLDLAVDAAGSPWLLYRGLHRHADGSWTLADSPLISDSSTAPELEAHAHSRAMFLHAGCGPDTCSVVRYVGADPSTYEVPVGDCPGYGELTISQSGKLAALAGTCGVIRLTLDEPGGAPRTLHTGDPGWTGQASLSLAIDDGGRLWVGTLEGLTIVGADDRVEAYPISRLNDISGALTTILVSGEGPPPPELGRERKGGLKGTIVDKGGSAPIANAKVVVCSRTPPCAEAEPSFTTTTDEEGKFEFPSLPLAQYNIGVELDGRWGRGYPKAMNMRAGMAANVGKVTILEAAD